jgi:hypothetical protein
LKDSADAAPNDLAVVHYEHPKAKDNFSPPKLELYAEAQINFGVICMHNGVNCTAPVPSCS